jgi:D-alanyl-D-alanine carboxypeptidase (penicillin-binding protein 5/6)
MRKIFFLFVLIFLFQAAFSRSDFSRIQAQEKTLDAPVVNSRSAVVMDAATGTLVYYKNPDDEIPPASLTKLMTMHLAFREISAGRASPDEILTPSRESWAVNQPPRSTVMGLANGQSLSLRELLLGLAIFSGNDAAVAAALRFAPSVKEFANMMNREAVSLGLEKTRFVEPSGISENNMTTAREFAEFCRFYIDANPTAIGDYHSVTSFSYPKAENVAEPYRGNPGTNFHRNHNTLLGKVEGVDGLKTGYIDESGYNIALSAVRGGTRFIVVILGAPAEWHGDRVRDADGERLLEWAFTHYKTVRPLLPELEPARVWKGKTNYVNVVPALPLEFTAASDRAEKLFWTTELIDPLIAPLDEGSEAGNLVLYDETGELRRIPLITETETEKGGFFKRLWDSIRLFFSKST